MENKKELENVTLITSNCEFKKELLKNVKSCKKLRISVAYASEEKVQEIIDEFQGEDGILIIGSEESRASDKEEKIDFKKYKDGKMKILDSKILAHNKMYYFEHEDEKVQILIGSNNLTNSGLEFGNFESSLKITISKDSKLAEDVLSCINTMAEISKLEIGDYYKKSKIKPIWHHINLTKLENNFPCEMCPYYDRHNVFLFHNPSSKELKEAKKFKKNEEDILIDFENLKKYLFSEEASNNRHVIDKISGKKIWIFEYDADEHIFRGIYEFSNEEEKSNIWTFSPKK